MTEWLFNYFRTNAQPIALGFISGITLAIFIHQLFATKNDLINDQLDELITKVDNLSDHVGVKNNEPDEE